MNVYVIGNKGDGGYSCGGGTLTTISNFLRPLFRFPSVIVIRKAISDPQTNVFIQHRSARADAR